TQCRLRRRIRILLHRIELGPRNHPELPDHLLHILIRITTGQPLQRAGIMLIDRRDTLLHHRLRTAATIAPRSRSTTIIIVAEEKSRRHETSNQQRNNSQHPGRTQRHPQPRITLLRWLWRHPTRRHPPRGRPELALLAVRILWLSRIRLAPLLAVRILWLPRIRLAPLLAVRIRLA